MKNVLYRIVKLLNCVIDSTEKNYSYKDYRNECSGGYIVKKQNSIIYGLPGF